MLTGFKSSRASGTDKVLSAVLKICNPARQLVVTRICFPSIWTSPGNYTPSRILSVKDVERDRHFMMDSGADVSVIFTYISDHLHFDTNFVLKAANRNNIKTGSVP